MLSKFLLIAGLAIVNAAANETVCTDCEMGLDAGHEVKGQLIQHGVATQAFALYIANEEKFSEIFYLWLDDESTRESQDFDIVSLSVVKGLKNIKPYYKLPEGKTFYQRSTKKEAQIDIVYNCSGKAKPSFHTLNLTLVFPPSTKPVSVSWEKICDGGPDAHHGDGWSGAMIFFFTVFILTLVFCVAGCGYNYVQREKQGVEMIPGIDAMRKAKTMLFPERRYTPQMNYDTAPGGDDNEYGATYQTNL